MHSYPRLVKTGKNSNTRQPILDFLRQAGGAVKTKIPLQPSEGRRGIRGVGWAQMLHHSRVGYRVPCERKASSLSLVFHTMQLRLSVDTLIS